MAMPPRVNANPAPLAGAAKRVTATKPPKVGAARGGPRGEKARGGTPNSGGGGYTPSNDPIPD